MQHSAGSSARTRPDDRLEEDQRLCCAVGFGAQNTTFCMAGQRSHADPRPAPTAARRTFSLAFSITQRDVVPSAEPDADRKPCAVWLA
jgi:hypothetical protein